MTIHLANICKKNSGITLVITEDNLTTETLRQELGFFLQDTGIQPVTFPDRETLPYDNFSPHQDLISERLTTLARLLQGDQQVVIITVSALMHYICPPTFLAGQALRLKPGQKFNINSFRTALEHAGYYAVTQVMQHGEFAIRGSIMDLYAMGSKLPIRIELFDDEIESLRIFSPDTQLTLEKIPELSILPAHEFPTTDAAIALFRQKFREQFTGNARQWQIYSAVSEGIIPQGIEYYLPLFFADTATFFTWLPGNTTLCLTGDIKQHATRFWQEATQRFEQLGYDISHPLLPPEKLWLTPAELADNIQQFNTITITLTPTTRLPTFPADHREPAPLQTLANHITTSNKRTLIVTESNGRREVLVELLAKSNIHPHNVHSWQEFLTSTAPINITTAPLTTGAELEDISIIVENQLFGESRVPVTRRHRKSVSTDLLMRSLAELREGAPIVHTEYGVGRYRGLQLITTGNSTGEFMVLEYAEGDKIYVPVTSLDLIHRYAGANEDTAPLHRLGTDKWSRARQRAMEKIHDTAIELLEIYAKRALRTGISFAVNQHEYDHFANGFPFEETPDQLQAINDIIADLAATTPMDRLVCGDVGFGKTEVAMRAAFIVVNNNKQVCVLAPTTLLASQHYATFQDRFADFPIAIGLLSRFNSATETKRTLKLLEEGKIDIVIGTHKLLQKDVKLKNPGLLIIDEEHRFGVRQKEYIKSLRANIEILSMTATPIPRTLNMAMASLRDISLIATPPARRLSIKTFWQQKNDFIVREAILREILRGGQVFFLHNKVDTINQTADYVAKLIPDAKVRVAHGQMRERELERIMSDFYHHKFNVLICTTIIETGIDIPTANTIIIDRADKFGLAQLHQLRGRVGRSHHQAYAWLLTPDEKLLTRDAVKRLEALVSLEDLGAGFTLASHDLDIRGAGELLGEEQSGNIIEVGLDMYLDMLNRAIEDIKSGKNPELAEPLPKGTEIDLRISAIIPDDYIHDTHMRLVFYKQIANATTREERHALQIELIDRFGLLPDSVKNLFLLTELKTKATLMGIRKISGNGANVYLEFTENPQINVQNMLNLIQQQGSRYQMRGPTGLAITLEATTTADRIHEISKLLTSIYLHP